MSKSQRDITLNHITMVNIKTGAGNTKCSSGCKALELSHSADRFAKWHSYFRKQFGEFL